MGRGSSTGRGRGLVGKRGMARGRLTADGLMDPQPASRSPNSSGVAQLQFIETTPGEKLPTLKARAKDLEEQLRVINARIRELEESGKDFARIACVDSDRCTGCGICEWVCPNGAISVGGMAGIDSTKCTGCGHCIDKCPQGALLLVKA